MHRHSTAHRPRSRAPRVVGGHRSAPGRRLASGAQRPARRLRRVQRRRVAAGLCVTAATQVWHRSIGPRREAPLRRRRGPGGVGRRGAVVCASHCWGTTCPSGPTASRATGHGHPRALDDLRPAPTSPISPRHVRAHKAQRPAGARCAAHGWLAARRTSRGEATRTADQGVAGASAAVPSRSSSVVPPTLPRSAGGPRGCPAQPALALPVVCPRATRPPPAQRHRGEADRRRSCTLVSCPRWRIPSGYGGLAPQTCSPDLFGGSGLRFHRVWVRMPAG